MYETIASGGDSTYGMMRVHLYPWSYSEKSACESGGIVADTLEQSLQSVINNATWVSGYELLRFQSEYYNYVKWGDIDDYDAGEIMSKFRDDYLRDGTTNGTSNNLYDGSPGVHQLIHGGFTGCDEDAGGYAPAGAGAERDGNTAFDEARVAWSPVCSANNGLTKNATIQETMHMFISHDNADPYVCDNDEHSLGKVYDNSIIPVTVTPMMTYHWDDGIRCGNCSGNTSKMPTEHDQSLTSCTNDAISATAYDWM